MTKNNEKILTELKKISGYISTTELAEKTNIDIKNISRYTKQLEIDGYIERKTIQNGKIRVVNIALISDKPIKKILPEEPKIISKPIKKEKGLINLPLIPSAKLNLLKYLYAQLTGKSTTNKIKKSMKKAVIEEISKF